MGPNIGIKDNCHIHACFNLVQHIPYECSFADTDLARQHYKPDFFRQPILQKGQRMPMFGNQIQVIGIGNQAERFCFKSKKVSIHFLPLLIGNKV